MIRNRLRLQVGGSQYDGASQEDRVVHGSRVSTALCTARFEPVKLRNFVHLEIGGAPTKIHPDGEGNRELDLGGRAYRFRRCGTARRRHPDSEHWLPHAPRHRYHGLHEERRTAGNGAADRQPRIAAHHDALRPDRGRDFARRNGEDSYLRN